MSFCEHCQGQRFDRAQVLRALRAARHDERKSKRGTSTERALTLAIDVVRRLEIPHLEPTDTPFNVDVVH